MRTIDANEMERERVGAVVMDVLPPDSFEQAHIPGAVNVPVNDEDFLDKVADEVPTKDSKVIVYCMDEECQASPHAAHILEEAGYTNVLEFSGGMKAWRKSGHELARPGHQHVYADYGGGG